MSKKPIRPRPKRGWFGRAGASPQGDAWHARKLTMPRFGWLSGSPRRPGKGPPGTSRGSR